MEEGRELLNAHNVISAYIRRMEERASAIELNHIMIHVRCVVPTFILPGVIIEMVRPSPAGGHGVISPPVWATRAVTPHAARTIHPTPCPTAADRSRIRFCWTRSRRVSNSRNRRFRRAGT